MQESRPWKNLIILLLVVLLHSLGCAVQRVAIPEIRDTPRKGLNLSKPVIFSVVDARSNKERSQEAITSIRNGLFYIYGNSLKWAEYFEKIPAGNVAVKIRLKANEANFGVRRVPIAYVQNRFSSTLAVVPNNWVNVVSVASTQQTLLAMSFVPQGRWIGTSWLEVEIVDKRVGDSESVNFPIVAEQEEPNTWGYKSASKATNKSWGMVSQHLLQILDSMFLALRDQDY